MALRSEGRAWSTMAWVHELIVGGHLELGLLHQLPWRPPPSSGSPGRYGRSRSMSPSHSALLFDSCAPASSNIQSSCTDSVAEGHSTPVETWRVSRCLMLPQSLSHADAWRLWSPARRSLSPGSPPPSSRCFREPSSSQIRSRSPSSCRCVGSAVVELLV